MKLKRKKKKKPGDVALDIVIYLLLSVLTLVCLYPMWYVLVASFTASTELVRNPGFLLWPKDFVANAYRLVFKNPLFVTSFLNSIKILAVGLPINIILTLLCGYFLSCTGMMWKRP
ncbi:MAG: carbohydrate ABC transporter permease, partial [Roseburia sp.]|nr:carbohydrate ABC transporter permease [Roseburia sp.]